jgi:hypothetical protein
MLKFGNHNGTSEPFGRFTLALFGYCWLGTGFAFIAAWGWSATTIAWHKSLWAVVPLAFIAAVYTLGVLCVSVLMYGVIKNTPTNRHPIIRSWTRDNVTAICAEADYQLWYQKHERDLIIEATYQKRPNPRFTGFFTDDRDKAKALNVFYSGSMEDCAKILSGCRIDRTELHIPSSREEAHGFFPITPKESWRLIYGTDPPEGTFVA